MRKTTLTLIGAIALVALAAPVSAHDFAVPVGEDTYYIYPHPDHYDPTTGQAPQVWKETNDLHGLQKEEVTVDGVTYLPDQRIA